MGFSKWINNIIRHGKYPNFRFNFDVDGSDLLTFYAYIFLTNIQKYFSQMQGVKIIKKINKNDMYIIVLANDTDSSPTGHIHNIEPYTILKI